MLVDLEEKKVYVVTHPKDTTKHLFASKQLNDTWICVTETNDQGKTVEFMAPCQVKDVIEAELERQKAAEAADGNKG